MVRFFWGHLLLWASVGRCGRSLPRVIKETFSERAMNVFIVCRKLSLGTFVQVRLLACVFINSILLSAHHWQQDWCFCYGFCSKLLNKESRVCACAEGIGSVARDSLWRDRRGEAFTSCSTLAATPVLFAHAVVTAAENKWFHHPYLSPYRLPMQRIYCISMPALLNCDYVCLRTRWYGHCSLS